MCSVELHNNCLEVVPLTSQGLYEGGDRIFKEYLSISTLMF
jgi:hypothetical protein